MSENKDFVTSLKKGDAVVGTMLRLLRNPAGVTLARNAGFDFVMLDMEHGAYGFEAVTDFALLARAENIGLMVRVPELSRNFVCRVLDAGVRGVMVPMLETVEQAESLVHWSRYPPAGGRGLSSSGGHTGHVSFPDVPAFLREQNERILTIAQIETVTGVQNAEQIACVPGIDALLIGPNDLAVSLGKPGETSCDEMADAIEQVGKATLAAGKIFGMHAGTALLERWIGQGMTLLMNDLDDKILSEGFKRTHAVTRELITRR